MVIISVITGFICCLLKMCLWGRLDYYLFFEQIYKYNYFVDFLMGNFCHRS